MNFRAFNKITGKYLNDFLLHSSGEVIVLEPLSSRAVYGVKGVAYNIDVVLEQSTGLYTNDRMEIYQGDKIKFRYEYTRDSYERFEGYVDFKYGIFLIKDEDGYIIEIDTGSGYNSWESLENIEDIEIIGNINLGVLK